MLDLNYSLGPLKPLTPMISQYTVPSLPTYFGYCGYIIFSAYYTESPPQIEILSCIRQPNTSHCCFCFVVLTCVEVVASTRVSTANTQDQQ